MRQINTLALGKAGGSVATLQRQVDFPKGQQCTEITLEAVVPLRNSGEASVTLDRADLEKVARAIFGNFSLSFGRARPELIDASVTFDDARLLYQYLTGADFMLDGIPLSDPSLSVELGIGETKNVEIVFGRAFKFERLGVERHRWCPGTTQMRQLIIQINRGAASLADATGKTIVQDASADITVIAEHIAEEAEDTWSPIIRMYRNHEAGMESAGPAMPGILLGAMEATHPGRSTPLGLFTLGRRGDAPIHDTVTARRVVRQGLWDMPVGVLDANDVATVLYQPPERVRIQELPVGSGFFLRQHSPDLDHLKTIWIYVPEVSASMLDSYIGPNAALNDGGEAKISRLVGGGVRPQIAAALPVSILQRSGSRFALMPGLIYSQGAASAGIDIPAQVRQSLMATIEARDTEGDRASAAVEGLAPLVRTMPGAATAAPGEVSITPRLQSMVNSIAQSGAVQASSILPLLR